jgi:hypothetical protein
MKWTPMVYGPDGCLIGSFVYFFCCASDSHDVVYIKIGVSDYPTKRLFALINNCALQPLTFGVCNVRSREIAFKIETKLHSEFRNFRTNGEWFKFPVDFKPHFSQAREKIFIPYRNAAWPMKISLAPAMPVLKDARLKAKFYLHKLHKRGKSFKDFSQHQSQSGA